MTKPTDILKRIINSAKKAWRGEEKLWIAFWGWCVLLLFVFYILNVASTPLFDALLKTASFNELTLFVIVDVTISTILRIFIIILVWRCARNSQKRVWFYCARTVMVIFILLLIAGIITSGAHWMYQDHQITLLTTPKENH